MLTRKFYFYNIFFLKTINFITEYVKIPELKKKILFKLGFFITSQIAGLYSFLA